MQTTTLDRLASSLSAIAAGLAGLTCLGCAGLILLEILLRNVFSTSTHVAVEFVGYGVAAMIVLGMGQAFERGAMIRVTLMLGRLDGSGAVRRVLECAVGTVTLAIVSIVIWFFVISAHRNFVRGYRSESMAEVPLWIPEGIFCIGLAVFWLQLVAYLLRVARGGGMVGGGGE
jgi:TRAP-type C4-dicarboxylate transport system permease small subunit